MSTDSPATDDASAAVRAAIAEADVGAAVLYESLDALDAVGEVTVADRTATVEVRLPVADRSTRDALTAAIEDAVTAADCGVDSVTVEWQPAAAGDGPRIDSIPDVKQVVAVASGKGGVGKSTVAANLAASLVDAGADVGLLDADVYGPNAPTMLGIPAVTPETTLEGEMLPPEANGVRVMSMDFVTDEDDPIIWRGPMVDDVLKQLFGDVRWGDLDYLIVDLPPGTGDAQLSLVQHMPVAGAVIVTTPQSVAVDDARRGLEAFARYDVPILGVVENMSGFRCPDCGSEHDIFDSGGAAALADEFEVPVVGSVPMERSVGTHSDAPSDPPGVTVPLVGRVQLPQTHEERSGRSSLPPVAVRDDGGDSGAAFRRLATRVAARVAAAARLRAGDGHD